VQPVEQARVDVLVRMISRERVTGGRDTQDFELRGREQREKRCGRGVGEFRIDGTRRGDRRRRVERRVTTRRSTSPFASIWIFNRGQHARIRLSKCRFHDFRSTPLLVLRESVERSLHLEIQYQGRAEEQARYNMLLARRSCPMRDFVRDRNRLRWIEFRAWILSLSLTGTSSH
jgi:hypothetical protein